MKVHIKVMRNIDNVELINAPLPIARSTLIKYSIFYGVSVDDIYEHFAMFMMDG